MKRGDFYREYYERTDSCFSDKAVQTKQDRENAWRKHQGLTSKAERKCLLVVQYAFLLTCLLPLVFETVSWIVAPFSLLLSFLLSLVTDFSLIKMECLYAIYRKKTAYTAFLYDGFFGKMDTILMDLKRATKKNVTGYVFKRGKNFFRTYIAVCRNKERSVRLTFHHNKITVTIDQAVTTINKKGITKEAALADIADVINAMDREKTA